LLAVLQQPSFEVYFFDELDRELVGVRVTDPAIAEWAESVSRRQFYQQDAADVAAVQLSMTHWFAHRKAADDEAALRITFSEDLYPNDIVILDARKTGFDFHPLSSSKRAGLRGVSI